MGYLLEMSDDFYMEYGGEYQSPKQIRVGLLVLDWLIPN